MGTGVRLKSCTNRKAAEKNYIFFQNSITFSAQAENIETDSSWWSLPFHGDVGFQKCILLIVPLPAVYRRIACRAYQTITWTKSLWYSLTSFMAKGDCVSLAEVSWWFELQGDIVTVCHCRGIDDAINLMQKFCFLSFRSRSTLLKTFICDSCEQLEPYVFVMSSLF